MNLDQRLQALVGTINRQLSAPPGAEPSKQSQPQAQAELDTRAGVCPLVLIDRLKKDNQH